MTGDIGLHLDSLQTYVTDGPAERERASEREGESRDRPGGLRGFSAAVGVCMSVLSVGGFWTQDAKAAAAATHMPPGPL